MSSDQCPTKFLSEEEIGRQPGLQDINWNPRIELYRIEIPLCACKKKEEEEEKGIPADQQFYDQERNSSLKQEESEPREIKEEPDEICTSQEREQFLLKQEENALIHGIDIQHQHFCKEEEVAFPVDHQERVQNSNSSPNQVEPVSVYIKEEQEELLTCQEGELLVLKHETKSFSITPTRPKNDLTDEEPNRDDFPVDERSHLEGSKLKSSGPTRHSELKPKKSYQRTKDDGENSSLLKNHCNTQCRVGKQHSGKACGKQLMTSESNFTGLMRTCKDIEPLSCIICGKSFISNSDLSTHMKIHTGPYFCKICGRSFCNHINLSVHMIVHTREKSHFCKTCGQGFTKKGILLTHMRSHTAGKLYFCETCGKSFLAKSGLSTHMRIHTGPFFCKTCGMCFSKHSYLSSHMRVHTGKKLHYCKTCGKGFTRNSGLLTHMRSHTGDEPYSCKTCGKGFTRNSGLLTHMRSHTGDEPYSCKTCGKGFTRNSGLLTHMRSHTGERPYSCKTCGRSFIANSGLSTHMRIHIGEYFCKICRRFFISKSGLSSHMRIHR